MPQENNPFQPPVSNEEDLGNDHVGQMVLRFALYFFLFIVFLAMVPLVLAFGAFVGWLCYAFFNGQ